MLAAGSVIGQRYRLTSLIGEGGMASVWRADDETLARSVAIKLLFVGVQRDPRASREQFLREARIAAAVQHRNVIHTVDFGTTEDGTPYMVMELLQGESLAERMERAPPLTVEELLRLAEMTLRGLSAVHEAGIVHRDLKPQNIFLHRDADAMYPKILDFGISRSLTPGELLSPVATQQGMVIGTPCYMAPEQARGEADIDKRADIYSMGAILYEGICGRPPFDGETASELLVKILSSEPIPLARLRPDLPEVLVHCVSQAMARDRAQRFVDALAFRRALAHALERAFPGSGLLRLSELPVRSIKVTSGLPRPQAANHQSPPTWGDFEGFASPPARRAVSAPVQHDVRPSAARVHASPEAHAPVVMADSSVDDYASAGPLGDSPLDAFAGGAAMALEIDHAVPRGLGPRRSGDLSATRNKLPSSAEASVRPAAPPARRSVAWWIVPLLLWLLLLMFLMAPGIVSLSPPDPHAAQAREAENPATRGSIRTLRRPSSAEPTESKAIPAALRELFE
ncbi:MAG: protein kinase [Polyangiales bacterium]